MAQYARPISDEQIDTQSAGNQWWAGAGVSQTNLYQQIDEASLDTDDFVRHKSVGSENTKWYKTKLGTISKPTDMTTVKVSVTSKRTSSGYSITIYLKYGSTTIKSWSMPGDGSATTNLTTLSESEADDIQSAAEAAGDDDWEDLQLWFLADDDNTGKTGFVYQAFLEAGNATSPAAPRQMIFQPSSGNPVQNGNAIIQSPKGSITGANTISTLMGTPSPYMLTIPTTGTINASFSGAFTGCYPSAASGCKSCKDC